MDRNVIFDCDGVVVCTRVPRAEVKRLQERRFVQPTRKYGKWLALVAPALIKQQLRRKITLMVPMSEANRTVRLDKHISETGQPVQYYELNSHICFSYQTTVACAKEHEDRALLPKAA